MAPKLNFVLMGVLAAILLSVVTALALSGPRATKPPLTDSEIAALVNRLGSLDPDVAQQARRELTAVGKAALPQLRGALSSDNKRVRSSARDVIDAVESGKSPVQP